MRRRELLCAAAAMAVIGATPALAQPRSDRGDERGRNPPGQQRNDPRDRQPPPRQTGPRQYEPRPQDRYPGDRRWDGRGDPRWDGRTYRDPPRYDRGAGPNRDFYPGRRLPPEYRTRYYVVEDWRGHGLRTPPRGYHWVQTGADYVLVAIATGIILELLLNH